MWKIVIGFIVFAAIALFVLMKSGGNIDLTGEKHDVTGGHAEPAASASPLLDGASAPIMAASGVPAASAASQ